MTDTTTTVEPVACTEPPWGDEIGCDAHADNTHRCKLSAGPHRTHPCDCGAMVIEDRR